MSGPPSRSDLRGWHNVIEHYTPDGTIGRLLFGAIVGLGLGSSLFFAGIVQVAGPVSAFLVSELVGLVAVPIGATLIMTALVVLWPVYLLLIGNIDSPAAYGDARKTRRGRLSNRSRSSIQGTEATQIEVLEGLYSTGDISRKTFERRLDEIVNEDSRGMHSSRDTWDTSTESETR